MKYDLQNLIIKLLKFKQKSIQKHLSSEQRNGEFHFLRLNSKNTVRIRKILKK